MRWLGDRESTNVEDQRGSGARAMPIRIGGLGAIILVVVGLYLGINPSMLIGLLNGYPPSDQSQMYPRPVDDAGYGSLRPTGVPGDDRTRRFVSVVLADTEDVWRQQFRDMGRNYDDPKLVLFSDVVPSAFGLASSASGPFYCPNDRKVYLDLTFFKEMTNRFQAPGEFAEA